MLIFSRSLAVLALLTGSLFAQNVTSLNGIATDSTGGVLTDVSIELTNKATNARRTAKTDAQGRYAFPQVTPGPYRLEAGATGFKAEVVDNLTLQVNSPATVNLSLQVGAVSETISVSSEAVLVNTVDASIGNAIG